MRRSGEPGFVVLETHRENDLDLRLMEPFDELRQLVDECDLDALEDTEAHAHIPYVVILLKYLDKWRASVSVLLSAALHPRPHPQPRNCGP